MTAFSTTPKQTNIRQHRFSKLLDSCSDEDNDKSNAITQQQHTSETAVKPQPTKTLQGILSLAQDSMRNLDCSPRRRRAPATRRIVHKDFRAFHDTPSSKSLLENLDDSLDFGEENQQLQLQKSGELKVVRPPIRSRTSPKKNKKKKKSMPYRTKSSDDQRPSNISRRHTIDSTTKDKQSGDNKSIKKQNNRKERLALGSTGSPSGTKSYSVKRTEESLHNSCSLLLELLSSDKNKVKDDLPLTNSSTEHSALTKKVTNTSPKTTRSNSNRLLKRQSSWDSSINKRSSGARKSEERLHNSCSLLLESRSPKTTRGNRLLNRQRSWDKGLKDDIPTWRPSPRDAAANRVQGQALASRLSSTSTRSLVTKTKQEEPTSCTDNKNPRWFDPQSSEHQRWVTNASEHQRRPRRRSCSLRQNKPATPQQAVAAASSSLYSNHNTNNSRRRNGRVEQRRKSRSLSRDCHSRSRSRDRNSNRSRSKEQHRRHSCTSGSQSRTTTHTRTMARRCSNNDANNNCSSSLLAPGEKVFVPEERKSSTTASINDMRSDHAVVAPVVVDHNARLKAGTEHHAHRRRRRQNSTGRGILMQAIAATAPPTPQTTTTLPLAAREELIKKEMALLVLSPAHHHNDNKVYAPWEKRAASRILLDHQNKAALSGWLECNRL